MEDIKRAIEIEKKYKNDLFNGNEYPLINEINKCGFSTLKEYEEEKRNYLVKNCKIKYYTCSVENIFQTVKDLAVSDEPSILVVKSDRDFVYHGTENFNEQYCKDNDIMVCNIGHDGGNIVVGKNDIAFGLFLPKYIDLNCDWVKNFYLNIFKKYNYNAIIDNNDILIDNYKIFGGADLSNSNKFNYVCNISFTDNSELIEKICNVPKEKSPGSIKSPLTRDLLEKEVLEWLQVHLY